MPMAKKHLFRDTLDMDIKVILARLMTAKAKVQWPVMQITSLVRLHTKHCLQVQTNISTLSYRVVVYILV